MEDDKEAKVVDSAANTVTDALDKAEEIVSSATENVSEAAKETHDSTLSEIKSMMLGLQGSLSDLSQRVASIADNQAKAVEQATSVVGTDIEATTEQAAEAVEDVARDIKPVVKAKKRRLGKKR